MAINEILGTYAGMGVPSVTATLRQGEALKISGLSQVTFTPAQTKLLSVLGAGDWQVGLDVAAGRYVVTAGTGQSGNFIVYDADGLPGTDEILGKSAAGGVPSVTVTLTNGEQIAISGLSAVTFTKK